jgi:DNA-binding NarL/FixJ family response regulator
VSREITLALADDLELLVDGLRGMFEAQPDIVVVGSAGDSASALTLVEETRPAVLLLDVSIIGAPVNETVAQVWKISPDTRIVVLGMHDDPRIIAQLIDLGISGYLLKSASWEELLTAVRMSSGLHDRVLLSVSRRSLQQLAAAASATPQNGPLSRREVEIMIFTSAGLTNLQIAKKLGLTEPTVKRHLHNIFTKLGAVSRLDAVNRATKLGILPTNPCLPQPR